MRRATVLMMTLAGGLCAAALEIVSVQKIFEEAPHSAFTDLIRFRDHWYCTFREGDSHVGTDGRLRVLRSVEGDRWESAALLTEVGTDLRDPKLSITPDGRLMLLAGGSVYRKGTYHGRQPRVTFSRDGRDWSPLQHILAGGDWLWRLTWHKGRGYGVSYLGAGDRPRSGVLYETADGVRYTRIAELEVPGIAEVTLRFLPSGEAIALARRESDSRNGWIGRSKPPYTQWTWDEIGHRLGGPNFIVLSDGALWAASRKYSDAGPTTVLARMTRQGYEPVLTLPSGGDTSYAGMVWHDGLLWMSYYSSHEGKARIYLAKIRLP